MDVEDRLQRLHSHSVDGDGDSPRAAVVSVLVQVDALPDSQEQAALGHGDDQTRSHHGGLHVS